MANVYTYNPWLATTVVTVWNPYAIVACVLGIIAVVLGVISLFRRCRMMALGIGYTIIGIACGGVANSALSMKNALMPTMPEMKFVDPVECFNEFIYAFSNMFPVLSGCAAGLIMVGITLINLRNTTGDGAEQGGVE